MEKKKLEGSEVKVLHKILEKVRAVELLIRGGGVDAISASKRDSRSVSILAEEVMPAENVLRHRYNTSGLEYLHEPDRFSIFPIKCVQICAVEA